MDQKVEDQLKDAEKMGYERGVSEKQSGIAPAFIAAQIEFEPIHMNKKMMITWGNQNREYHYADLAAIIASVRPALNKNGLAIYHELVIDGAKCTATPVLLHKSGEKLVGAAVTIIAKDQSPHAVGSAMTYAKRYSLTALLNVAAEDDDDGTGAMPEKDPMNQDPAGKPPKAQGAKTPPRATQPPQTVFSPAAAPAAQAQVQNPAPQPPAMTDEQRMTAGLINQQQFEELKGLLKTKGIDPRKWKVWLAVNADGAKSISEIKSADYLKIKDAVEKHPEYIMNPRRVETPPHQLGD